METPPAAGKPVASLTPRLLARKGGARPAMRPQSGSEALDDLGWNDMGEDEGPAVSAEVVPILRDTGQARRAAPASRHVARTPAREAGRRAAFTLRLDAERHLRLRLACALDDRTAQDLVTDALDRLLAEMPEVAALVDEVGRQRRS